MGKIIVTSGGAYTDIDTLASVIAYADLLNLQGRPTEAVLIGKLNQSVSPKVRCWDFHFATDFPKDGDKFIIMDLSEPAFIPKSVPENRVMEIFDHHFGFERYWKEKLGEKAKIEKIGACATLVWEEYEKQGKAGLINQTSANLLFTAIIANTLNFHASVTDVRDKKAYQELRKHTDLPSHWAEEYYRDLEQENFRDPLGAIKHDTKISSFPNLRQEIVIGQMELWDSQKFIKENRVVIEETLKSFGRKHWFFTSPSISEGKNYIFTKDKKTKSLLKKIIEIDFAGDLGGTKKLWLRKELLKKLQDLPT